LQNYLIDSYRSIETPANVTYHTPDFDRSLENEGHEEDLLALSRESFSVPSAGDFTGSETVPVRLPLPVNDQYVSQQDGNIRNLSTHFNKGIVATKIRPDSINSHGHDLYKTIILPDMALPKTSKHQEGTQMNEAHGSSHHPAISGS